MTEYFLHYIWQFQYFDKKNLKTSEGAKINIIKPGTSNPNEGPDFLNAEIEIDHLKWFGSIEIHLNEKDWKVHKHDDNEKYKNVILHVVYFLTNQNTSTIPTLELKNRVDLQLIKKWEKFKNQSFGILCANMLDHINPIYVSTMQEKALITRLERKGREILERLDNNKGDWDQTAFETIGKNFGFKINSEPFLSLCQKTPFKIVRKINHSIFQLEALLFGQAGFLEDKEDDPYHSRLAEEFTYQKNKYHLKPGIKRAEWNFLRLRPANFPTLRIAQFSALLYKTSSIFSDIAHQLIIKKLASNVSEYWQSHYSFHKKSNRVAVKVGKQSIENILINSVAPLLFSYGMHRDDATVKEQALKLLEEVKAEKNSIISKWNEAGINAENASHSQALIELYNEFCKPNKCLSCSIGTSIITP